MFKLGLKFTLFMKRDQSFEQYDFCQRALKRGFITKKQMRFFFADDDL